MQKEVHDSLLRMEKLITAFDEAATRDYRALGKALQVEVKVIISTCTMTGEGHDQLHILLNPMLMAIKALATEDGGRAEFDVLRNSWKDYHSHFES